MNRNQLKYLVILAMLIDHIAWAFVLTASPAGQLMHLVGRLTAPTMAYFIAEGYRHTQNVKKYVLRLALFALLSWAPFVYFEFGYFPIHIGKDGFFIQPATGVIYTLLLGLLAICLWDRTKGPNGARSCLPSFCALSPSLGTGPCSPCCGACFSIFTGTIPGKNGWPSPSWGCSPACRLCSRSSGGADCTISASSWCLS